MGDLRKKMLRKCDQAKGNIETAQEHLLHNVMIFSEGNTLEQLLTDFGQEGLPPDKYRYADKLNPMLSIIAHLDDVADIIDGIRDII